jgi:hypothetical protein
LFPKWHLPEIDGLLCRNVGHLCWAICELPEQRQRQRRAGSLIWRFQSCNWLIPKWVLLVPLRSLQNPHPERMREQCGWPPLPALREFTINNSNPCD